MGRMIAASRKTVYAAVISVLVCGRGGQAADQAASSCSASDIQSAVDACIASDGGTVTIPSCDAFDTWGAGDRVTKVVGNVELRVIGQGTNSTKIGYAPSNQTVNAMFRFVGAGFKELGNMSLRGDGYSAGSGRGALAIAGAANARIHHIVTENFAGPTAIYCATSNMLVDHCVFRKVLYDGTYQWYAYGNNTYPTDWRPYFGSANYDVFFEDNVFNECHHPVSLFTAAKVVIRYNNFVFSETSGGYTDVIDAHSCCYGDCPSSVEGSGEYNYDFALDRGGRAYEIYCNNMSWEGSGSFSYFARIRSGSVIFASNTVTAVDPDAKVKQAIQLVCEQNSNGPRCTEENGYPADYTYSNNCNGTTDGCCDRVETSYVWDNTLTRVDDEYTLYEGCGAGCLQEERDFFLRPPDLPSDGFAWIPYTYPHPLASGLTPAPPPPTRPHGLRVITE